MPCLFYGGTMAEFNMRFSPKIIVGTIANLGGSAVKWGNRALMIADKAAESASESIQEQLDSMGIDTILFAREGLCSDSVALEETLSLARGSHAEMIIGFGGEDILSLARLTAAAAPGRLRASSILSGVPIEGVAHNVLEIPVTGRHALLFREEALLSDLSSARTILVPISAPPVRTVILDASLSGRLSTGETALELAALLAAAADSYLSSRSGFLSDVQATSAIGIVSNLLREVKENAAERHFRSRMIEASVLSALATGLTAPGSISLLSWAVAAASGVSKAASFAVLLPWILESPLFAGSPKSGDFSQLLTDSDGMPTNRPADDVRALFGRIGLPGRLRDLGVTLSDVMPAAEWAAAMIKSDRSDLDEAAFRDILEIAS